MAKRKLRMLIGAILTTVILLSSIFVVRMFKLPVSIAADELKMSVLASMDKYINYNLTEQDNGTLVQYTMRTGIEYEDNQSYVPIKQSEINVNLNQIDGKYPSGVKVITKSTGATNGNNAQLKPNYVYDNVTGNLTITASNQNENGEAVYTNGSKEAKDEYVVICYYDTYVLDNPEREIGFNISAKINVFRDENNEISKDGEFKNLVSENIGELTSVEYETEDIYNGYIKSNAINGTEYTTDFKEIAEVVVSKKEVQDKITLTESNVFIETSPNDREEITRELGNGGTLVYKSTKITKQNIQELLGEEGTIHIQDNEGNIIAEINKDTEYAEDGTLTIVYENELQVLVVKTSKVVNEGILKLENTKEIKAEMQMVDNIGIKTANELTGTKEEIVTENINNIDNNEQIETEQQEQNTSKEIIKTVVEQEIYKQTNENIVNIKEAQTEISFAVDNKKWTNEKQNELTFEVKLNSNGSKYNMFQNPSIRIDLPSEVEKVILEDGSILYGNGLRLNEGSKAEAITNEDGSISIMVNIEGEQTEYIENNLGLVTNIKIPAIVILKKDIENTVSNSNLVYSNEYGNVEEGSINKEVEIINYKEEGAVEKVEEKLLQIFEQPTTQNIQAEDLKVEIVPTRGESTLKDDSIVYEGEYIKYNIKVTNNSSNDMEDINLKATIPEGVTYGKLEIDQYNYEGTYKYNFEDETREIEIKVGAIKAQESVTANYEVKVNNLQEGEISKNIETKITPLVGTQELQRYEQKLTINPAEVQAFISAYRYALNDNSWYFEVDVNTKEPKEVPVKIHLPEGFTINEIIKVRDGEQFGERRQNLEMEISDDNVVTTTLASEYYYSFQGSLDTTKITKNVDGKPVEKTAYIEAIGKNATYVSNVGIIQVQYHRVDIEMTSDNEGESVRPGDEINYTIKVSNDGGIELADKKTIDRVEVTLSDCLPENVIPRKIIYSNWSYTVDENNGITGLKKQEDITEEVSQEQYDEEGTSLSNIELGLLIPKGESVTIYVKTIAKEVLEDTTIDNIARVTGSDVDTMDSARIYHKILAAESNQQEEEGQDDDEEQNSNSGNSSNGSADDVSNSNSSSNSNNANNTDNQNNTNNQNSISGVAWLDENKDGQRQSDERLLNNIEVLLISIQNGGYIQDKTTTNYNGLYSFNNLSQGNYLIAFKYDTNRYRITEYKRSDVDGLVNSDATNDSITLNGEQTNVGITDIIELSGTVENIDIGLIENELCDFKIDKYISKVTVQTQKGIKEYKYDNKNMAKVEIRAKEIEGAIVTVEYQLVITNIGETVGKVGKIIDSLPQGLEIASEGNNQWAPDSNGSVSCLGLSSQTLAPGQSKAITLTTIKTMTGSSTGTFVNKSEISEVIDSEGVQDANTSNNVAQADLIISVSTGAIVYISIAIGVLGILIVILFILNKTGKIDISKFNNLKVLKNLSLIVVAGIIAIISTSTAIAASSTYSETIPSPNPVKTEINRANDWGAIKAIVPNSASYTWTALGAGANGHSSFSGGTGGGYCTGSSQLPAGVTIAVCDTQETDTVKPNNPEGFSEINDGGHLTSAIVGHYHQVKKGACFDCNEGDEGAVSYTEGTGDSAVTKWHRYLEWWENEAHNLVTAEEASYTLSTSSSSVTGTGNKKYEFTPTLKLKAKNGTTYDDAIKMERLDKSNDNGSSYYIYGPFKFKCKSNRGDEANPDYKVEVRDNSSSKSKITSAQLCSDSSGTNLAKLTCKGEETATFYIKIPKNDCLKGVSSVKVSAEEDFTVPWTQDVTVGPVYSPSGDCQDVHDNTSFDVPDGQTGKDNWNMKADVTWLLFKSCVEIEKYDYDEYNHNGNTKLTFSGVKMQIKNSSTGDDRTDTTKSKGKVFFDNLNPNKKYNINEQENPRYGYYKLEKTSMESTETNQGKLTQIEMTNTKQTGNLRIIKQDADSTGNKARAGMQFRLQKYIPESGSYEYVVVSDNDYLAGQAWVPKVGAADAVTGAYVVGSMQTTPNSSGATIFKTNEQRRN